jgi:hypothetical protein
MRAAITRITSTMSMEEYDSLPSGEFENLLRKEASNQ